MSIINRLLLAIVIYMIMSKADYHNTNQTTLLKYIYNAIKHESIKHLKTTIFINFSFGNN